MSAREGRPWPWGLVGMLVLVAAVEHTVARHELGFTTDPMVWCWELSRRAARDEATHAEVLCLGDSLVKLGVLPGVIRAGTGRSAYNLAVPGAQAAASEYLLRRVLAAGGRPRAVVVDFYPPLLAEPARNNAAYWPKLLPPGELAALGLRSRDPRFLSRTAWAVLLPSFECRHELRGAALAALRGGDPPRRDRVAALRRTWRLGDGATARARVPVPPDDRDACVQSPWTAPWAPVPSNADDVRRFLDLAASRGVPVFWLLPPSIPGWLSEAEGLGLVASHERFVRETSARHPNVVVLDARRARYPRDLFIDPTHLDRRGAVELSADVADALAPVLSGAAIGSRWVVLPSYRGRTIDVPVEDLEQSRLAVAAPHVPSRR
jgi:hypothetical protein